MRNKYRLGTTSALLALLAAMPAAAQDIFLAQIGTRSDARNFVLPPVNITNRAGYDNQPMFTPDGRSVLYTSTREDQQADIYRYDIGSKVATRLTQTAPESEYSAAVVPAGNRFSVIRVERDSSQRLWSFALNGSDPEVVIPDIKPVGYHTWVGSAHLALFVLGSPNTLQLYDTRTRRADTLTTGIGRSLVTVPSAAAAGGARTDAADGVFSYVKREGDVFTLYTVNTQQRPAASQRVTTLPAGSEYVAWLSASTVVTGQGSKLLQYDMTNAAAGWTEMADLTAHGVTRISRLAIGTGAGGVWIAIVAEPAAR